MTTKFVVQNVVLNTLLKTAKRRQEAKFGSVKIVAKGSLDKHPMGGTTTPPIGCFVLCARFLCAEKIHFFEIGALKSNLCGDVLAVLGPRFFELAQKNGVLVTCFER